MDAYLDMTMHATNPKWRCPVCDIPFANPHSDVFVCTWTLNILNDPLAKEADTAYISPEGKYTLKEAKEATPTNTNNVETLELLSDDEDDEDEVKKAIEQQRVASKAFRGNTPEKVIPMLGNINPIEVPLDALVDMDGWKPPTPIARAGSAAAPISLLMEDSDDY